MVINKLIFWKRINLLIVFGMEQVEVSDVDDLSALRNQIGRNGGA